MGVGAGTTPGGGAPYGYGGGKAADAYPKWNGDAAGANMSAIQIKICFFHTVVL
jgi:hypothetical protein